MKFVPDSVDFEVGHRLRKLRRTAGMTQTELGSHLGVTFQQIQKYEKGANRIAASRMHEIARLFGVPISMFFEPAKALATADGDLDIKDPVIHFVSTAEGKNLNLSYWKLAPNLRLEVRRLCQALADMSPEVYPSAEGRLP
ncbi:helix-turn-helix domain-containing protein [Neorhizobium sp. BT27B]|uniref:helix-turn-helix domain-containing protein n=1 Tax=Neorhizobium sp. BT27B TaxID=3142625 RepID=UPI003D2D6E48